MSEQDFIAALPLIILAGTGLIVMLWDAFEKKPSRVPLWLTVLGGIAAIYFAACNLDHNTLAFNKLFFDTTYSNFFTIVFSVATILSALLADKYLQSEEVLIGEFSALVLFAATGMVMMASGANLIVTFLGLEIMSICFYILAGMFRRREESNEAALKYFLLGAFATGFFLYGIALIYGTFGTMSLEGIRSIVISGSAGAISMLTSPLLIVGVVLLIIGLAFKVAAFPFHQWAPDVYQGSPTVVAGYMSTAGKAAAFSAFVAIFGYALLPGIVDEFTSKIQIIIIVLAASSMLYGNIVAIAQKNIKRMLAYSSTAHAGYILLGVAAMNTKGLTGIAIYTAVYTLMQIAAFGMVALLEKENVGLELENYSGLAKRRPTTALILAILMLSLAGIPPFAGFFGKYYLFLAALESGLVWLAIIGVVSSIIAAYFYLRLIVLMYFGEPVASDVEVKEGFSVSYFAVGLASAALIAIGLFPGELLKLSTYFVR
jgi:NADH-quinone oxidoreductase subunit N